MKIKIEHIFAIAGIELLVAAVLINIITWSSHYFSEFQAQVIFHPSNGFAFLMQWAAIYGIFAMLYFVFGWLVKEGKE